MIIDLISLIAFVALVLYIIFGGADYGAGILEIFRETPFRQEQERTITAAMGPVWEANHIWLILIVVILFNGFPAVYLTMSTFLHLPLVAVLLGLVVRGTAFSFRHYDVNAGRLGKFYTLAFSFSSLWTSLWLGVTAGACLLGRIDSQAASAVELYVAPWANGFCFALGLFVASVFSYLAASFLVGEADNERLKKFFRRRMHLANFAVVLTGGLVFLAAEYTGFPLARAFFTHPGSLSMMALATLCWLGQWFFTPRLGILLARGLAAGQVFFILVGYYFIRGSVLISTRQGPLTFASTAAPAATLVQLLVALLVGLVLILPSLFLLFWVFKFREYPRR